MRMREPGTMRLPVWQERQSEVVASRLRRHARSFLSHEKSLETVLNIQAPAAATSEWHARSIGGENLRVRLRCRDDRKAHRRARNSSDSTGAERLPQTRKCPRTAPHDPCRSAHRPHPRARDRAPFRLEGRRVVQDETAVFDPSTLHVRPSRQPSNEGRTSWWTEGRFRRSRQGRKSGVENTRDSYCLH